MVGKALPPQKQLKVNKTAVEQRMTASKQRLKAQDARSRRIQIVFSLIFIGFFALCVVGVKRRAPWYVAHVEPFVDKLAAGTDSANGEDPASADDLPVYQSIQKAPGSNDLVSPAHPDPRVTNSPEDTGIASKTTPPATGRQLTPRLNIRSRPRPADLDFFSVKDQLRRYVRSQPKSLRALEKERLEILASVRQHIILLMRYVPYETGNKSFQVKSGRRMGPGIVVGANERGFLFVPTGKGRQKLIPWADIALEQYADFFKYYIAERLGLDGMPSWNVFMQPGTSTPIRGRRDAAGECLLAGLLCDWYGKPEEARKFLLLAVQYDPGSPAGKFLDK